MAGQASHNHTVAQLREWWRTHSELLSRLTSLQRQAVELRFGVNGQRPHTLDETARLPNLSIADLCELLDRARVRAEEFQGAEKAAKAEWRNLTPRLRNLLEKNGVTDIPALLDCDAAKLQNIPFLGKGMFDDINAIRQRLGYEELVPESGFFN